jgi:hypothetical protein
MCGGVALAQPRAVHLSERRSRERGLVETGVVLHECQRQLGLCQDADLIEALRRHLVLQAGELVGDLGGKDVEARREELTHLDHESAHLDGERAEAHGDRSVARGAVARGHAAQADPAHDDLPEDEAEGDSAEEQHDAPVASAEL